jgi:preprotein translocase subunit SecE
MVLNRENQEERKLDWLKWLVILILLLAGFVSNHYYSDVPIPLRLLAWLGMAIVLGFIASTTQKGKRAIDFIRESRLELRKVVWPSRQETMQVTMVVAVVVVVLALILWGMDGILVWLIGWLTGQRS